ncbi:MAG TPA: hypothetical protein VJ798_08880 [Rhizomicrobium sp.]|nr:hypothetical protein [Rhizomicrobium sp.]
MTKPKKKDAAEASFDAPARITDRHILLNPEAPARWQRWGVRDDHPLTKAYERGQLASGRRDVTPRDRYEAGLLYRGLYEDLHGSSIACSKLTRVSGGVTEARAGERICAARALLARIESRMSADNAFIIRRVCGEGAWPSEAVREACVGFEKFVIPRLCVALDDLVGAVVRRAAPDRA